MSAILLKQFLMEIWFCKLLDKALVVGVARGAGNVLANALAVMVPNNVISVV